MPAKRFAPRAHVAARVSLAILAAILCSALLAPAVRAQTDPPSTLAGALDRESARVEAHLADLERLRQDLDRGEGEGAERSRRLDERIADLSGRLQLAETRSPSVASLYEEIVTELKAARPRLAAALEDLPSPPSVPSFDAGLDLQGLDAPSVASRLDALRGLLAEIEPRARALEEKERSVRWDAVHREGEFVERLNELRISALGRLPASERGKLLGLTREGVAQFRREIDQTRLSVRLYLARTRHDLGELPRFLTDVFAVGAASWTAVKVLLILVVFLLARMRGRRIRAAAERLLRGSASDSRWRRRGQALIDAATVVAPWGMFLLLLWAVRAALGAAALRTEVDLVLRVAFLYGAYRLAIDVLFASTVRVARRYRLALDERRTNEVLRTVRALMRAVVGILVVLMASRAFLGRGFLYTQVVRFGWVVLLITGFVLLARWRATIADTYLALRPDGRLSGAVKATRERWYGVFVSAAAFAVVSARALVELGRDFAMGFDQTRRALAFVFRRRVEKQAERVGYAEVDLDSLPDTLRAACAENPVSDGSLVVERFPGLDELHAMIEPWLEDDVGASYLLTGQKGTGKTSWLGRVQPDGIPVARVALDHRVLTQKRLAQTLAEELELSLVGEPGLIEIRKALNAGPKRIVTVDRSQNLFLATVGGYDTFEAFVSLVEETCGQVFWICAVNAFAWDHLFAVRPDLMVFRHHQALTGWSEEEIGLLLQTRNAAAGVQVVYDDALLEGPIGRYRGEHRMKAEAGYTRLLWDYSDGNPRVALHYWLRSLVPESSGRVRVRLFRSPRMEELDGLHERGLFLLAAIVVHENLNLQEAAQVTRYPLAVCRIQLERLEDRGIVRRLRGRYRLTTHWHRTVLRSLRRRNLIAD